MDRGKEDRSLHNLLIKERNKAEGIFSPEKTSDEKSE